MQIGFIGLGNMGAAIAANLVKAHFEVAVWNRNAAKARDVVAAGAVLCASPREVASGREVVMTMLADDAALEAVMSGADGVLAGLQPGGIHISLSTIAVATADRFAEAHRERGQRFICAPVFGRPEAAAAAALTIAAAGEAADLQETAEIFAAISKKVFTVGTKASVANLVKLCGNFMIMSSIEIMGEALALAEKGGVAKAQFLEVMTSNLFDAPVFRNYGKLLVERSFTPAGFAAPLGLKDMRLVGQSAEALRVPMPLLGVVRDHLLQTIAAEGDEIDWSGIGLTIAKNAGL